MNQGGNHHETEFELINMINLKNDAVFDILYEKYWSTLLNFAGHYLSDKDTCKEIVQELFITLHSKRNKITITTSLSSYLYSSLRNKIMNYIRDQSVYKKHIAGATRNFLSTKNYNNVEQFMNFVELKKGISDCLNTMPVRYKEVYVLYMENEFTLSNIAVLLKRPLGTVEKQFRKAACHLRDSLRNHQTIS